MQGWRSIGDLACRSQCWLRDVLLYDNYCKADSQLALVWTTHPICIWRLTFSLVHIRLDTVPQHFVSRCEAPRSLLQCLGDSGIDYWSCFVSMSPSRIQRHAQSTRPQGMSAVRPARPLTGEQRVCILNFSLCKRQDAKFRPLSFSDPIPSRHSLKVTIIYITATLTIYGWQCTNVIFANGLAPPSAPAMGDCFLPGTDNSSVATVSPSLIVI